MKTIKISLAGVSFRGIKGIEFDVGMEINLQHDPMPGYPKAIKVTAPSLTTHLGYIPEPYDRNGVVNPRGWYNNQKIQDIILDLDIKEGVLVDYKYKDGADWNREHKGILHFVEIATKTDVVLGTPEEEIVNPRASQTPSHRDYTRFGEDVISITELLKYMNPEGDNKYLEMWMINNHANYDEFEAHMKELADKGTEMHNQIEECITLNSADFMDKYEWWKNFDAFYSTVRGEGEKTLEQQVYDKDLNLAGTYDCKIGDAMIDWKSSKSVYLKHKLQIAFYAKMTGCKRALVVPLGYKGKIMTPVNKNALDEKDIDRYYQVVVNLKKCYDLLKGE